MPENSKTAVENRIELPRWTTVAGILAVIFTYMFGLTIPLLGPDEPRYAQVAREMFERGDWITPTLGGATWFEKPALLYWLQIASYHVFGVNEFAARLGSAVFGLATIACIWMIVRTVRRVDSEWAARIAVMIAASTLGLIVFSRGASFDIVLTFPITAALAGFWSYEKGETARVRNAGLAAFYFFIGVAVLAKGLVGIVFPFAIVGLYFAATRRWPRPAFLLSLAWGTMLAAAVAAVWYAPMYARHGYKFVDEFFIQHHFQRFTSNKYFHPQPFYFFLWVLPLMTLPWLPFFGAAVWTTMREAVGGRKSSDPDRDLQIFAAAWIAVPLAFFSFSGSKLPGYIMPAVPATILLTTIFVCRWMDGVRRRENAVRAIAAATLAIVVVLLITVVPRFAAEDTVKHLIAEADTRGFAAAKILGLHTTSHNAEFYGAGRLVRLPDGRQRRFLGTAEVREQIDKENGEPVLVIVPLEYLSQLENAPELAVNVIASNAEVAIAAASAAK